MTSSLMYNYDTANWYPFREDSTRKDINCSGVETRLIDCPLQILSYTSSCNYLLLKCRGYTLPTGRPTPIPTVSLTPVTTDPGTSLTSSQSTVPEVVSSPDIIAPQSTSEDGPPLAALATASSLALFIIAAILLLFALISIIIWKKRMLNREKSQRYEYFADHVVFACDQLYF